MYNYMKKKSNTKETFIQKLDTLLTNNGIGYPNEDKFHTIITGISNLPYLKEYISHINKTNDNELKLSDIFNDKSKNNIMVEMKNKITQDDILEVMIPSYKEKGLEDIILKRDINIINESYWLLYILSSKYSQCLYDVSNDLFKEILSSFFSKHHYPMSEQLVKGVQNVPISNDNPSSSFEHYIDEYNKSTNEYTGYKMSAINMNVNENGITYIDELLEELMDDVMDTYIIQDKNVCESYFKSIQKTINDRKKVSNDFRDNVLLLKLLTKNNPELEDKTFDYDSTLDEEDKKMMHLKVVVIDKMLDCRDDNIVCNKLLHLISSGYDSSLFLSNNILIFNTEEKLKYLIEKIDIMLNSKLVYMPLYASTKLTSNYKGEKIKSVVRQDLKMNGDTNTTLHNLWYYSIPIFIEQYFDIAMNLLDNNNKYKQMFIPDILDKDQLDQYNIDLNDMIVDFINPKIYKEFIRLRDKFNNNPKPSFLKYNDKLFECSIIS